MPTPAIYASISRVLHVWPRKSPRLFWGSLILIAGLPPLLERFVPALGEIPGRFLFVVLVTYISLLAPYYAFREYEQSRPNISKWLRSFVCTLWILFCGWAIYAGLFSEK
jgi:hypothetical protein